MRTKHLPIAEPCHEDWSAMDRVDRGRFCQACVKKVYDLSSMTEREAKAVLEDNAGSPICVRFQHDRQGKVHFASPTPPPRTCTPPRRLGWAGAAVMAATMAACTPHGEQPPPEPTPEPTRTESLMGGFMGNPTPKTEPVETPPAPASPVEAPPARTPPARNEGILGMMAQQQVMGLVSPVGAVLVDPDEAASEPCDPPQRERKHKRKQSRG